MKWGIVGTGVIARQFAAALARVPGARLAGIASRSPERAAAFLRETGAPEAACVADAAALAALATVEVLYVGTPHHRHEADAIAAIAAGKPVLVEKPLAPDAAAARRIAEAARAAGVFAMEGLWSLCQPVYREAFARIAAGEIGAVRAIAGNFAAPLAYDPANRFWDPAQGGGALLDRGVYLAALALEVMEDPRAVWASARRAPSGVDAATAFALQDAAGRQALLSVSLDSFGANEVVVEGTRGRCSFLEPVSNPPAYVIRRAGPAGLGPPAAPQGLRAALRRHPLARRLERGLMRGSRWRPGGLEHEIVHVEHCLAEGRGESPLVPLDRSLQVMEILEAAAALAARPG
jgi:predicted dehydrogenase